MCKIYTRRHHWASLVFYLSSIGHGFVCLQYWETVFQNLMENTVGRYFFKQYSGYSTSILTLRMVRSEQQQKNNSYFFLL